MSFLGFLTKKPVAEVSYSIINEEHAQLIQLAAELRCAAANVIGDSPEQRTEQKRLVESIILRLIRESQEHFVHEEMLMQASDYPGYREHRRQHQILDERARDYYRTVVAGERPIGLDLASFYKKWLSDHIRTSDRDLELFLNDSHRATRIHTAHGKAA